MLPISSKQSYRPNKKLPVVLENAETFSPVQLPRISYFNSTNFLKRAHSGAVDNTIHVNRVNGDNRLRKIRILSFNGAVAEILLQFINN